MSLTFGLHHRRETHAHADHLTSSRYLKAHLHGKPLIGIGGRISQVQKTFAPVYGHDDPHIFSDSFDVYWKDDEEFKLGRYSCSVIHLPGHTPDHVGYVFGSAIFTGDSIFNVSFFYHNMPVEDLNSRLVDSLT